MGYERYPRGMDSQRDYNDRGDRQDYGSDYGSGRDGGYAGGRSYQADRDGGRGDDGRGGYGQRYGAGPRGGDYGRGGYGSPERNRGNYGDAGRYGSTEYHGSYGSDGHRFEDVGRYARGDDDNYRRGGGGGRDRGYGRQPQGYDYQDRGFFERAGDEVRSWFGDEEAERRREADARYEDRQGGDRYANHNDSDYHNWRSNQVAALDRDYDEYRRENRSKFESEFASWRTNRQGQRDQLGKVTEHMDVVGSDGEHVGTVDKTRGDRILLTKNDKDADGHHHSIPSSWIGTVDTKVTLTKTAQAAKDAWRDEENSQALFNYGDRTSGNRGNDGNRSNDGDRKAGEGNRDSQGRMLNRSFSGTY